MSTIPGKPDVVLTKYNALILVNGCFWHGHSCHIAGGGASRLSDKWQAKVDANVTRDQRNILNYRAGGWKTLVVWECALSGKTKLGLRELSECIEKWILYDSSDAEIVGRNQ